LLSSVNSGLQTNGSQFFLTTAQVSWLDKHHVVFGRVVNGKDVVKAIEKVGSSDGTPSAKVMIKNCGEVKNKNT